jgi:3-deoxy-7-phosphoheptulonate synthase
MLLIMKKRASETELEQVKEFLVTHDCDFHQSTGSDRIILGIVGDSSVLDRSKLQELPGVLDTYRIPEEN